MVGIRFNVPSGIFLTEVTAIPSPFNASIKLRGAFKLWRQESCQLLASVSPLRQARALLPSYHRALAEAVARLSRSMGLKIAVLAVVNMAPREVSLLASVPRACSFSTALEAARRNDWQKGYMKFFVIGVSRAA